MRHTFPGHRPKPCLTTGLFQDYFSSYETGLSVGGAKTGEPREKPPDTPASRTWLVSHVVRVGLEPAPVIKKQRS